MVTSARDWKSDTLPEGSEELTLPSGNTCLARRLSPEAFLTSGVIPDRLTDMITKAVRSKKGLRPDQEQDLVKDPQQMRDAFRMIDQAVAYVVLEPRCQMPPACEYPVGEDEQPCGKYFNEPCHENLDDPTFHAYTPGATDPDVLYVNRVDLQDRLHIFNWAMGGTRDAERFRGELATGMGHLSSSKGNKRKAKRTTGRKR